MEYISFIIHTHTKNNRIQYDIRNYCYIQRNAMDRQMPW